MTTETITIVFLVLFGAIFGWFTARSSQRREAVHGGAMAHLFNYLASALWASVTPTVLLSLIVLDVPFLNALLNAVIMVGIAFVFSILFAIFEQPAIAKRKAQENRGWTAQDAVNSGL